MLRQIAYEKDAARNDANPARRQMTHDPEVYSDPMAFRPERFIPVAERPAETDPSKVVFGFGRRACPGRILGENALFVYIAQTLAVFNIKVPENLVTAIGKGESQKEEALRFTPGTICRPEPFDCTVTLRSKHHQDLVHSLELLYPWEASHGEAVKSL